MFHFAEYLEIKVKLYLSESKNVFVSQRFGILPLTKNTKKSNSSGGKTSSYFQEKGKVKMFHFAEYLEIKVKLYLSESKNVFVSQRFGLLHLTKNTKKSNSSGGKTSSYFQEKGKVKMFHFAEYLKIKVKIYLSQPRMFLSVKDLVYSL